jgi:hypothetical protein
LDKLTANNEANAADGDEGKGVSAKLRSMARAKGMKMSRPT